MFALLCATAICVLSIIINRVRGDRPFGDFHHRHIASILYAFVVCIAATGFTHVAIMGLTFWVSSMLGWAKWQSCGTKAYNEAQLQEDSTRNVPWYNAWCELFAPKPFDGDARKKMGINKEIWTDCHCMIMRMALVFLPMACAMSLTTGHFFSWVIVAIVSSAWMGLSYYLGTWNKFVIERVGPITILGWKVGEFPPEFIGGLSWAFPLLFLMTLS